MFHLIFNVSFNLLLVYQISLIFYSRTMCITSLAPKYHELCIHGQASRSAFRVGAGVTPGAPHRSVREHITHIMCYNT